MAKVERLELNVLDQAMHCAGCVGRIEAMLDRMPGVLKVKADHRTQKVSLTLDTDRAPLAEVKQMLEAAGYRTG